MPAALIRDPGLNDAQRRPSSTTAGRCSSSPARAPARPTRSRIASPISCWGRRSPAHHARHLLAPRGGRAEPARRAAAAARSRPRGRRRRDAGLRRHVPRHRRAAVARIRRAPRARRQLHHPRPRGQRRSDGADPPRRRPVRQPDAFPDQGDLPRHLFARRQRARDAGRDARQAFPLGRARTRRRCARCSRPTSRPSRRKACSITTTCCSISPRRSPSRRWRRRSPAASTICWSTNTRTPTRCRPRSR